MPEPKVLMIPIDEIFPDISQPRQHFDQEMTDRMAASITARGLLQPVRVRWDEQRACWQLVCGEGRWRGAKQAKLTVIPAIPVAGDLSETDMLSDQIIENVVRNSLRPLELARSLDKLKRLKECTSKLLSVELGISGASITRAEALLTLPGDIQAMIDDGAVSANAGYEISRLPDPAAQRQLAQEIAAGRVSRDGAAATVQKTIGKRNVAAKAARLPIRLAGGINVTVSAETPLTWDSLLASLEQIRKQAEILKKTNRDVAELPRSLATHARSDPPALAALKS